MPLSTFHDSNRAQDGTVRDSTRNKLLCDSFSTTLAGVSERYLHGSVKLGADRSYDGRWLDIQDLTDPARTDKLLARLSEVVSPGTPKTILGNYLFRYTLNIPLRVAGHMLIAERRVPSICGNVVLKDFEWLQHGRFLEPQLIVLPGDPLADYPGTEVVNDVSALMDALFAEIEETYGPLISAFGQRRFVAVSNAWGSILDALAQGVLDAGRSVLDMDTAWARWNEAIAGRTFPSRRRPVRFTSRLGGMVDDIAVRAGCCLWFMLPEAKTGEQRYCVSCYLMGDNERKGSRITYLESLFPTDALPGPESQLAER